MQIQLNPEELTVTEVVKMFTPLVGKRCWFRLAETETATDRFGAPFERNIRIVATFLRIYVTPDFEIRFDTSEGVLAFGEFISIENYERHPNDGKDRYTP